MYHNKQEPAPQLVRERNRVVTQKNRGEFWKACPGTGQGYICCGYQIITPVTGCGMYCSYCILQEYFDHQHQVACENFDDLAAEIRRKLSSWKGVARFGTGEFGDSLYLEKQFGFSRKIAGLLDPYPNAIVEFKTKTVNIEPLRMIENPSKAVIGFSMNTPYVAATTEHGTAPMEARIEAARTCEEMGFWIAFHFDPMVWYTEWNREYRHVVDAIFSRIRDPSRIAWVSMGGFRTVPSLKKRLLRSQAHLPLFSGEMIIGSDNKYRYFKPVRVDFYAAMKEQIQKYYPDCTMYLCMENADVWEESGLKDRIADGLTGYLDCRARNMLGLDREKKAHV
jgi:spore photoproduct lyase